MSREDFTLIIPAYNSGKYLPDLFASIYGGESSLGTMKPQTLLPSEVVVCDDCSTDDTEKIVSDLQQKFPRIVYLRLSKNSGTPVACNEAIKHSTFEIITRIDADDMRESESFELMLKAQMEYPDSMIYDNVRIFLNGSRQNSTWMMPEYDFENLLQQNFIHSGVMFPKKFWKKCGGYPEDFTDGRDDWSFNVSMGAAGCCGVHVTYPGYLYRRERQNRSLRNSSSEWQKKFFEQMTGRFPDLYAGRYPMACCGNRSNRVSAVRSSSVGASSSSQIVVGETGMTILEYLGGNYGTETYYGPVTRTAYKFSRTKNRSNVDNRDLHAPRGQGLLDMNVGGKPLFRVWQAPVEAPAVQVKAVVPEPVEEPIQEIASSEMEEFSPIQKDQFKGIGQRVVDRLLKAKIQFWEQFVITTTSELVEITGLTAEVVDGIKKELTE